MKWIVNQHYLITGKDCSIKFMNRIWLKEVYLSLIHISTRPTTYSLLPLFVDIICPSDLKWHGWFLGLATKLECSQSFWRSINVKKICNDCKMYKYIEACKLVDPNKRFITNLHFFYKRVLLTYRWRLLTFSLYPVSYTHLDVYKRQGYKLNVNRRQR